MLRPTRNPALIKESEKIAILTEEFLANGGEIKMYDNNNRRVYDKPTLIYITTGEPVLCGDIVKLDNVKYSVEYFKHPHKPSSEGKISIKELKNNSAHAWSRELYVSVLGMVWVSRNDR